MTGLQTWTTRHGDTVEVFRAGDGFRYRVQARNGEIVEQGSEGYARVEDAAEAASRHHPVINDLSPDDDGEDLAEQLVEHLADEADVVAPEELIEVTR